MLIGHPKEAQLRKVVRRELATTTPENLTQYYCKEMDRFKREREELNGDPVELAHNGFRIDDCQVCIDLINEYVNENGQPAKEDTMKELSLTIGQIETLSVSFPGTYAYREEDGVIWASYRPLGHPSDSPAYTLRFPDDIFEQIESLKKEHRERFDIANAIMSNAKGIKVYR